MLLDTTPGWNPSASSSFERCGRISLHQSNPPLSNTLSASEKGAKLGRKEGCARPNSASSRGISPPTPTSFPLLSQSIVFHEDRSWSPPLPLPSSLCVRFTKGGKQMMNEPSPPPFWPQRKPPPPPFPSFFAIIDDRTRRRGGDEGRKRLARSLSAQHPPRSRRQRGMDPRIGGTLLEQGKAPPPPKRRTKSVTVFEGWLPHSTREFARPPISATPRTQKRGMKERGVGGIETEPRRLRAGPEFTATLTERKRKGGTGYIPKIT